MPPDAWSPRGARLLYVISPPRSGSSMLRLMLESHSRIRGSIEPCIMVPLRHAGYFGKPREADYDHVNASNALRQFVALLPGGEDDYVEACRAYAGELYRRKLEAGRDGARYFLDKTPENTLEWEFVTRVFPDARYLVLTRHPLAVFHSSASSFFLGDYERAWREYDLLGTYLPKIAAFLREAPVDTRVVRYEDVVRDPEREMRAVLGWLGLDFEPAVVEFGTVAHEITRDADTARGARHGRPTGASLDAWVGALAADPAKAAVARRMIEALDAGDLETYGFPKAAVLAALPAAGAAPAPARRPRWTTHRFKRHVYFAVRRVARRRGPRALLERVRFYCDVLLREHPLDG
jgi:Sulfotransferase family